MERAREAQYRERALCRQLRALPRRTPEAPDFRQTDELTSPTCAPAFLRCSSRAARAAVALVLRRLAVAVMELMDRAAVAAAARTTPLASVVRAAVVVMAS
jgi:hypothetical protein